MFGILKYSGMEMEIECRRQIAVDLSSAICATSLPPSSVRTEARYLQRKIISAISIFLFSLTREIRPPIINAVFRNGSNYSAGNDNSDNVDVSLLFNRILNLFFRIQPM